MTHWIYRQSTGELGLGIYEITYTWESFLGTGYAGTGAGRNNPDRDHVKNEGPLPRGWYTIGEPRDTPAHGPFVMRLIPDAANEMHGRAGFLCHGDNPQHDASLGCIVLARTLREALWKSGTRRLQVIR